MTLEEHIQDIKNKLGRNEYLNEPTISQGIVSPLLRAMGWDTYDTTKAVIPAYQVRRKKVDFALCVPKYNSPVIFIKVKKPGKIEKAGGQLFKADRKMFEYAYKEGTPFVVATDGKEWHFYLTRQSGNYDERKVYKLDLTERDANESSERLQRYLSYDAVSSGKALEDAKRNHKDISERRQAEKNIPEAWEKLIEEKDEILLEVIREKVENICGVKPTQGQVASYLESLVVSHTSDRKPSFKSGGNKRSGGGIGLRKIRVTFPDETVIYNKHNVTDTFVKTIRRVGAKKIQSLNMRCGKYPLISKHKHGKKSARWHDVGYGFYVDTNTNTSTKLEQLKGINKKLRLGLRIKLV